MSDIVFNNETAPATPTTAATVVYVDSTTKLLSSKDDAGTVTQTVAAFDATAPTTSAVADAAAAGSAVIPARRDHRHGREAFATPVAVGFANAAGSATTIPRSDHVHDVALTTAEAFATATTSISAATYADVTGVTITLAAGTWIIMAFATGFAANLAFLMHVAVTDNANAILAEASQFVPASGTASVDAWGNIALSCIVTPGGSTAYKMRAARGLTTLTNTFTMAEGAGVNVSNNASDASHKATSIRAIQIA